MVRAVLCRLVMCRLVMCRLVMCRLAMCRVVLALLLACSALSLSTPALADTGEAGVHVGAMRLGSEGARRFEPTLRSDLAFELVGPLHAGGYVQVVGLTLPLTDVAFGGGVALSVRPSILRLRPVLEVAGGRQRFPSAQQEGDDVGAWVTSMALGLGIAASDHVVLEARVTHAWLHQVDDDAVGERTWLASFGVGIRIP